MQRNRLDMCVMCVCVCVCEEERKETQDIVVCMCSFVAAFEHALFRMHVPKPTQPFSTPFLDEPTQMGTFV